MLNARSLTESYLRNLTDAEPLAALEALAVVQDNLTTIMTPHVHAARTNGYTWQDVGDVLGVSRQAAFNRFSKTAPDAPRIF